MSEELITPENLSKELLKSIMDAAFMDVTYDSDGDLKVKEDVTCFVLPNLEKKDTIKLITMFSFKPESTEIERLRCVNQMNDGYIIVRATSTSQGNLLCDFDILVAGGITPKNFVLSVKRFCAIPRSGIEDYGNNLVE